MNNANTIRAFISLSLFLFFPIMLLAQNDNAASIRVFFDHVQDRTKLYLLDKNTAVLDSSATLNNRTTLQFRYKGQPESLIIRDSIGKYIFLVWADSVSTSMYIKGSNAIYKGSRIMSDLGEYNRQTAKLNKDLERALNTSKYLTIDSLKGLRIAIAKKFIANHNSFFSLLLLYEELREKNLGVDYPKQVVLKYPPHFMKSDAGVRLATFIKNYKGLKEGDYAPEFSLNDTSGTIHPIDKYRGKYLLLTFWASWCSPCLREFKELEDISALKGRKLAIIGISLDTNLSDFQKTIKRFSLSWPNFIESGAWFSDIAVLYGVSALPTNVLISPEGKIISLKLSPDELSKIGM